jgi:RimJ/RimL family protein N-acetyltransferase
VNLSPVTLELPAGIARLEPLREEHAGPLFDLITDEDTWRYLVVNRPTNIDEMLTWMRHGLAAAQRGAELPFIVIDRRDGRIAGTTRFMDIMPSHRNLEIGVTAYGAPWRRTPMNTECKLLMLQHAFDTLGCERVQLKCDARNERSRAAILRIGATFEGILRKHRVLEDGFVRDTAMYSIIREEWPAIRDRLTAMLKPR